MVGVGPIGHQGPGGHANEPGDLVGIGYASGDATQADLAATADLREADTSPVLKLESFLRRSLRSGQPGQ